MAELLGEFLSQPDPTLVKRLRQFGVWSPALAIVSSICVVLGWTFNLPILTVWLPSYAINRITGSFVALLLDFGIVALYLAPQRRAIVRIFSAIAIVVSVLSLIEYAFPIDFGIDQPLHAVIARGPEDSTPGRMSPNGALVVILFSLSTALLTTKSIRSIRFAHYLTLLSASISFIAVIGYAYSIESLYGIAEFNAMSLPGAVSNVLLAAALLFVRPDEGIMRIITVRNPAGVLARRMFAAVIILPPMLGSVALGLHRIELYDLPATIAVLVVASMATFAGMIAITTINLERSDVQRRAAELELAHSREGLRELSAHVQSMQEQERIKIAREVHDELGQSLTAMKMDIAMLKRGLPESDDTERRTGVILSLIDSTIKTVQRISRELRPGVLDDLGLAAAIEWQAHEFEERSGIICDVTVNAEDITVDQECSTALFRIFQETLTNIARHANATQVDIRLDRTEQTIALVVEDDGVGIDETQLTDTHSLGLMGMRERAKLLGGTFELRARAGGGTSVQVSIPLHSDPTTTS